jgi:Intracellular proteinase inhibitor
MLFRSKTTVGDCGMMAISHNAAIPPGNRAGTWGVETWMTMDQTGWTVVLPAATLLLLAGCNNQSSPPNPASGSGASRWPQSAGDSLEFTLDDGARLRLLLHTDKDRYAPGDTAEFVLEVTNLMPERTVELKYSNTQVFDFEILDADGKRVWWFGEGRFFGAALTSVRIGPGATKTYRHRESLTLAPGEYVLVGRLPFPRTRSKATGPSVRRKISIHP